MDFYWGYASSIGSKLYGVRFGLVFIGVVTIVEA